LNPAERTPSQTESWIDLHHYLGRGWLFANGKKIVPSLTFCDAGYLPSAVAKFASAATGRYPSHGTDSVALPWVFPHVTKNAREVRIHTVAGKLQLFAHLAITDPAEPGYMHFHAGLGADYFKQLTAEVAVDDPRRRRLVFQRTGESWNEILDLSVLAMGAFEYLYMRNLNWAKMARYAGVELVTEDINRPSAAIVAAEHAASDQTPLGEAPRAADQSGSPEAQQPPQQRKRQTQRRRIRFGFRPPAL
jgi:phage terminase large subunit GpA-like protein